MTYRLTTRTITENASTEPDARCALLVFNEAPPTDGSFMPQLGSCSIPMTREEAAEYHFGVDYPDAIVPLS